MGSLIIEIVLAKGSSAKKPNADEPVIVPGAGAVFAQSSSSIGYEIISL
jgi:hypothetical protein